MSPIHLATWIRECDTTLFEQFFALRPDIRVSNARTTPIDLTSIHGLLLTGGADVAAEFHNEPPYDPSLLEEPEPNRDPWEFDTVRNVYERGLPILAICKGVQVLNLALGGSLHLDIRNHDLPELESANVQPLRFATQAQHRFEKVNSSHHQAINRVADALEVEAWHIGDDIIEQVRIRNYPWGIGVQYHPERDKMYTPLFEDFFGQMGCILNKDT